jgi:hypothetical protein
MKSWLLFLFLLAPAQASTPTPTPYYIESDSLLHFTAPSGSDVDTLLMIDNNNRLRDSGNGSLWSQQNAINNGNARAKQMVDLLKNQDLQKAFTPLNAQGKQMLQENPDMRNPVTIVGGAAAFWIGRSIALVKQENFKLTTHVEARARCGEFAMESPLLNGKLSYTGNDGINMKINRKIDSISSSAEANYNATQRVFSGQLVHPLIPHLDITFGAAQLQQSTQTDGRASLQYNLNF